MKSWDFMGAVYPDSIQDAYHLAPMDFLRVFRDPVPQIDSFLSLSQRGQFCFSQICHFFDDLNAQSCSYWDLALRNRFEAILVIVRFVFRKHWLGTGFVVCENAFKLWQWLLSVETVLRVDPGQKLWDLLLTVDLVDRFFIFLASLALTVPFEIEILGSDLENRLPLVFLIFLGRFGHF